MRVGCTVICQIVFRYICSVDGWFCSQKIVILKPCFIIFIIRDFKGSGHLSLFQMCFDSFKKLQLFGISLVHLCLFCDLRDSSVQDLNIREDQLQIDGLNISCRINGTIHMDDVRVLKTTYYMNNGIYFTDICKELVTKSFSFAGSFYKACNVHEFDGCRCHFLCMIQFSQLHDPLIRYGYNSYVRINGCKRIVCRQCSCLGQGVK